MAPKFFVTGATGYIGGDALYEIATQHPDYDIAVLVRDSDRGAQVASQYANIRLVYGSLDHEKTLEEEAKKADIVLNFANADHETGAKSLVRGLAARGAESPSFLIHTSGTGNLTYQDSERKTFGEASSKVFDDWDGISEITSFPEYAPHRKVDKLVIEANDDKVRTAIVCPPTIYGDGRGPGNKRGHQLNEMARCTLEKKKGITVGAGKSRWANVHIHDLSKCYLKLIEAAIEGGAKATWGREGYYFTENGEHFWGDMSKLIAKEACKQGFIPSDDVSVVSAEEADEMTRMGGILWAANSRCKAIRARKLLQWSPAEKDASHEIPAIVTSEAKLLGLVPGHAAKVAA